MGEFTELLKFLHGAGTSIIPWVIVCILIWAVIVFRPHVISYIKSKEESERSIIEKEGERNEIIRNCSATIEACTTVLEMAKTDREKVREHIDEHETMSKERMEHIQTVVNQCRDEITKARGDLKGINARLDNLSK